MDERREYGVGRVPADVDPASELLAQIEAAEIVARQQRERPPVRPMEPPRETDSQSLAYLLANLDHLRAEIRRLHDANPHQLGRRHWQWLVGHASTITCSRHQGWYQMTPEQQQEHIRHANELFFQGHRNVFPAAAPAPSWWGDWYSDDGVLHWLAYDVLGGPPADLRVAPMPRCMRCGAVATMSASLGPACVEHYDDLSD